MISRPIHPLNCIIAAALLALPATAAARPNHPGGRKSDVRSGVLTTSAGLRLRLTTDVGSVHVHTGDAGQVRYEVHLETDSDNPAAENWIKQFTVSSRSSPEGVSIAGTSPGKSFHGSLWVEFDVTVPLNYNLDVATQGGNITVDDLDGRETVQTMGGHITAGRIGGPGRLETMGGHIFVREAQGDLVATTAGGHITVGDIQGTATLKTGGGHIKVGSIAKTARLDTGAGNVSVVRVDGELTVSTGGGQIEIGSVAGSFRARTGGGGIKVASVSGTSDVETGGGSIYLTKTEGTVRASTGAGGITAWFGPNARSGAGSDLQCTGGDIVVYLAKETPLTIDATIEAGDEKHLVVDPQLPLQVSYQSSGESALGIVRLRGSMNGGGGVLRLRTVAGKIRLVLLDTAINLQKEMIQQQLDLLRHQLELMKKESQK